MLLRARKRRGARRAQRQLEVIGAPPHDTSRKFLTRVRWVTEYGGIHRSRGYFGLLWDTVWRVLRSPHYSLRESVRALGAIERTQELLLASVNHFDLRTTVRRLEVPIAFFQSRHDVGTNPHVVAHYAAELDAPEGKSLVWFEGSAHMPYYEESRLFREALLRVTTASFDYDGLTGVTPASAPEGGAAGDGGAGVRVSFSSRALARGASCIRGLLALLTLSAKSAVPGCQLPRADIIRQGNRLVTASAHRQCVASRVSVIFANCGRHA